MNHFVNLLTKKKYFFSFNNITLSVKSSTSVNIIVIFLKNYFIRKNKSLKIGE